MTTKHDIPSYGRLRNARLDCLSSRRTARERLIAEHLPLVRRVARRYAGLGEPLEDLEQVGSIGLIKAVDRYDPARGIPFRSYALPTIRGEIGHYLRDRRTAVRVPSRLRALRGRVLRQRETLTHALGRTPRSAEIARAADVPEDAVSEALACEEVAAPVPLDEAFAGRSPASDVAALELERGEHRTVLAPGLDALDRRSRLIVYLRFFEGMTQADIAAELRISQMHVSRLLGAALETMRSAVEGDG
jgi:RNA polymerase sigma-B factor